MGPFQDFAMLPFRSSLTLQSFLTEYLSPPCWMRQSWRTSSFIQKAFHPQMIHMATPPSMNNLPQQTILFPFPFHLYNIPPPTKKKEKKKKNLHTGQIFSYVPFFLNLSSLSCFSSM